MSYRYEVQDVEGVWHEITAAQYIAYRLDGAPVRRVPVEC
jgi:hypothetical protein